MPSPMGRKFPCSWEEPRNSEKHPCLCGEGKGAFVLGKSFGQRCHGTRNLPRSERPSREGFWGGGRGRHEVPPVEHPTGSEGGKVPRRRKINGPHRT